jgi:Asp-tRNA(Asn)/Glu-tRNA(Gln) amidotransferase A subunit family amidase
MIGKGGRKREAEQHAALSDATCHIEPGSQASQEEHPSPPFSQRKACRPKSLRVGVMKARPASLTHNKERHMYENTFK